MADKYASSSIEVLEGLEAVRLRPGMYIGTTGVKGMHHILWEIVDNGIDEISNGYGDTIEIEIYKDNSISVKDNGRGIPIDIHPTYKVPGVELVFTKLHAGGKFNNSNYAFSGGLHGVGASVTNALSEWLNVEIFKEGTCYKEEFHSIEVKGKIKSGIIKTPLYSEPCDKKLRGTKVTFLPDRRVFNDDQFDYETIAKRIKDLAFLNPGLKISIVDNRQLSETGRPKSKAFHFESGIKDFVTYLNEGQLALYDPPIYLIKKDKHFEVSVAFQHTQDVSERIYSYVNNIPTTEGGTHETGFKSALTKVLNDFGRQKNIIKQKDENYYGEDFREGMTAVLSVKMQNVQFEGQTKTKLGNPETKVLVESLLTDALIDYFNKAKKDTIDAIFKKADEAAKTRMRVSEAKNLNSAIKSIKNADLLGKLASCSGKKAEINELYIVEGDSAGGSAKQGRDRSFQAILPLRGKPLNSEKQTVDKILQNAEFASLINALGTGFGKSFNVANLKYDKIIILADADFDGGHIRSILLAFFFRYMKQLIIDGHVYTGLPPLYKITDKKGVRYVYDDATLKRELDAEKDKNYTLQRYKGLGEMNPSQLWETTMDPARRTLVRITIEDAAEAERLINILMGDDVPIRRDYINEYADFNRTDSFKELKGKGNK